MIGEQLRRHSPENPGTNSANLLGMSLQIQFVLREVFGQARHHEKIPHLGPPAHRAPASEVRLKSQWPVGG